MISMSNTFDNAITNIVTKNQKFAKEAYYFINSALSKALQKNTEKPKAKEQQAHVRADTLVYAFRDLALEQYGPLSKLVLAHWGIEESEDIGKLVYLLIEEGIWSKTEEDKLSDFANVINFEEAFTKPFLPAKPKKGTTKPKKTGQKKSKSSPK